jgi:hypothetical protein
MRIFSPTAGPNPVDCRFVAGRGTWSSCGQSPSTVREVSSGTCARDQVCLQTYSPKGFATVNVSSARSTVPGVPNREVGSGAAREAWRRSCARSEA